MRIIFSFLALTLLFSSCDDGDVITTSFEFDDTFQTTACDGELICHKIKTDPTESLSVVVATTLETLIETITNTTNPLLVDLVNSEPLEILTNQFNYRTYSNEISDDVFCNAIPPSNLGVANDYSTNVDATFTISLTEDDNDGIPAELEDDNIDDDNDPATNPTDTDGDGIPDYIDVDDDGDNVLTATEIETQTITTEIELSLVRDTDGDGIPNYLDTDDDNDGILTINEEGTSTNQNPADDIENNTVGADYLNSEVMNDIPATAYRENTISQEFLVYLKLSGIVLPTLIQDELDFGTLTTTGSRTVTPTF